MLWSCVSGTGTIAGKPPDTDNSKFDHLADSEAVPISDTLAECRRVHGLLRTGLAPRGSADLKPADRCHHVDVVSPLRVESRVLEIPSRFLRGFPRAPSAFAVASALARRAEGLQGPIDGEGGQGRPPFVEPERRSKNADPPKRVAYAA